MINIWLQRMNDFLEARYFLHFPKGGQEAILDLMTRKFKGFALGESFGLD